MTASPYGKTEPFGRGIHNHPRLLCAQLNCACHDPVAIAGSNPSIFHISVVKVSPFRPGGRVSVHPRTPGWVGLVSRGLCSEARATVTPSAGCGGYVCSASGKRPRPAQSAYGSGGSTTGEVTFACQRMEIGMQAPAAVLALHVALPMASRLAVP